MARFAAETRTVNFFREQGFLAGRVDCFNHKTKRTRDLFGIFDLLVVGYPGFPTLFVQATAGDGGNHAARRWKVLSSKDALATLEAGNGVAIVSWRKGGAAGKRKLWTPRIELLTAEDWDM